MACSRFLERGRRRILLAGLLLILGLGCGQNNRAPENDSRSAGGPSAEGASSPAGERSAIHAGTGSRIGNSTGALAAETGKAPPEAGDRADDSGNAEANGPAIESKVDRRLFHACSSAEELVTNILAALNARDKHTLELYRINKREHDELLWPEFPAKDLNTPMDFNWDMLNTRSWVNAGRAIEDWGGKNLTLISLEFTRGVEPYETFVLHRGTVVTARTGYGEEVRLRIIGSVVELDGQFKVLSYKDWN